MKRPVIIGLLIVALSLVCLGIVAVAFFRLGEINGFARNNPFDRRNIPSEVEETKTLKVDPEEPLTLNVIDEAGGVTITGGDVDTVQVKAIKTAYDSTQARADEEVKNIQYTIEQDGNSITLKYQIPESMNFSNKVNTVDFLVSVPTETRVDVVGSFGELSATGLQADVSLENNFGDIRVRNVNGALVVRTDSGRIDVDSLNAGTADINLSSGFGSVSLSQASGADVTIDSQSGAVEVEDLQASGDVELASDFGNVSFENGSAGTLSITTKNGAVEASSVEVAGALTVQDDFGNINLVNVEASSYDTQTNSGSITIDGAQGPVKAETGFGNITVKNAENATLDLNTQSGGIDFEGSLGEGPHTLHSDFGEIEVSIPADSALNVKLQTDFGKIISEIPITLTLTGDMDQAQQQGTMNGGGAEFSVSTKSGSITITTLGE